MAIDIAELGLKVRSDGVVTATDRLDKMGRAAGRAESSTERLGKAAAAMGRTLALVGAAGGAALAAFTANSIKLGIAAEETASKFQTVFRGSVEAADKALIDLTRTVPLTISEMRGLASGVQDMLVPMGLAREDAAGLSVEAVKLAADLASFNNTDADVVLQNIQSALAGSSEPLRKFGIDVREAALESVALKEGIIGVGESMNSAQRAQAVFAAITRDSADAIGDLERTADSTANRIRAMRTSFKQIQEDLGTALLPTFNELLAILVTVGEDGISPMQRLLNSLANGVIDGAIALIEFRMAWNNLAAELSGTMETLTDVSDWFVSLDDKAYEAGENVRLFLADLAEGAGKGNIAEGLRQGISGGISSALDDISGDDWLDLDSLIDEIEGKIANVNLEKLVKQLQGAKKGIEQGVRDPLQESATAASDIAVTVEKTVIPALKRMSSTVSKELANSFAFITEEGFNQQAEAIQAEIDALNGGTEAWREYNKQLFIAAEVGKLQADATDEQKDKIAELADSLFEARDGFGGLVEQAATLGDTMEAFGGAFSEVIKSIQGGVERGTDEYKKLEIAVQAANIVQAIGAILNQANGDPYTAVPRMAAMASIVASLVGTAFSISGLSGGADDPTEARQNSIGTGTVLGDSSAQSESIMKALDITADATSEIVGINRGMLRALTDLTNAISGAGTLLARGFGSANFGPLPSGEDFKAFGFDKILGKALDPLGILGGSVKVADTGIKIDGGSLQELIDGALVFAFQDLSVKKNIFSSSKIKRGVIELEDAIKDQFGMVFQAIADTVSEAAKVLGFSSDEIQAAMDRFVVYAQDISFEDLNAEEQQEALTAFFGTVFDRLAAEVVPMLADLQKVGEGMGETLVRVATSIQVFDSAVNDLGFSLGVSEDMFATSEDFRYRSTLIKVALVEAAGGIESFISSFQKFFDLFASEGQKFTSISTNLNNAFSELGLVLPESRDQVYALMQAQSAETEVGRQRIALLLELGPLLDDYYSSLESQFNLVQAFTDQAAPAGLVSLRNSFVSAMEAAKSLGASQQEYALIMRSFDRQMQRFTAQLTINVIQQSQALFGSAAQNAADEFEEGFDGVRRVANSLFAEWQRALTNIKGYADGLLLDENLTTLNPTERLAESERQFNEILRRAQGGDVDAAADLPRAAQAFLEEARFMFASGEQFEAIFSNVQAALRGIEMPKGIEEYTQETATNTFNTNASVERMQNETVQRLDRLIKAMDLANTLRELGFTLERSPIEMANELGVPLERLAFALGIDLKDSSLETVMGIVNMAEQLGADIYSLGDALGVDIERMANTFGVELDMIDFDSMFMDQNDWLSSINDQLIQVNHWLSGGASPLPESDLTPSINDPLGILPESTPAPFVGPVRPGDNGMDDANAQAMRDELGEIRTVLTQILDDNSEYYKTSQRQGDELVRATSDTNETLRLTA